MPQTPEEQEKNLAGSTPSIDPRQFLLDKDKLAKVESRSNAGDILAEQREVVAAAAASATQVATERAEAVAQAQATQPKDYMPRLQTFQSDMQSLVTEQHIDVVSVAAAEARRRAATEELVVAKKNYWWRSLLIVIFITLLFGGALAMLGYTLFRLTSPVTLEATRTSPLARVDAVKAVTLSANESRGQFMGDLVAASESVNLSLGLIEGISISSTDTSGTEVSVPAATVLNLLSETFPPQLSRTLKSDFLLGVHVTDGNQPFLLLKVDSYADAYAAMLVWERSMRQDLYPLFNRTPKPRYNSDGTVAATPQVLSTDFVDANLANHDVRTMRTTDGDTTLLWTFLDHSTILVTTNESTLRAVVGRITTAPYTSYAQ